MTRASPWPLRLYVGLLGLLLVASAVALPLQRLGPPPLGKDIAYSTLVVDRNGHLLRPFITKGGYWRLPVTVADVDRRFLDQLVAYEDKRFRSHHGIDPLALLRAAGQAIWNGRIVSGGSTLTMQVARLLEPRPARRFSDKLAEMVRAVQLERQLSKDEILESLSDAGALWRQHRRDHGPPRWPISARSPSGCRPPKPHSSLPFPRRPSRGGPTAGRTRRSRRATG